MWYDALQIGKWSYFQFFVLGILVRKYKDWCVRWSANRYVAGGVIAAYILMAIVYVRGVPMEGISNYLRAVSGRLLPYASIGIVTMLFYSLRRYLSDSKAGQMLQRVGRNTLGVYLIHYFFLAGNWSFLQVISTHTPPLYFVDNLRVSGSGDNGLLYGRYPCVAAKSAIGEVYDRR